MVCTRSKDYASSLSRQNASHSHHSTPQKARIREAAFLLRQQGCWNGQLNLTSVFRRHGVSKSQGYAILREKTASDRTFPLSNSTTKKETRGRKHIISPKDIFVMDQILQNADVQQRSISWATLGYEAGLAVSTRTIKRTMGRLDYHKCIACRKGWVNQNLASERLQYAKILLKRYPTKQHWRCVRFSDEVHYGLGPQGKLLIIRKPGQRYCANCIQEADEPNESDRKKLHAWAAVGYNFKSDLVFYEVPTNTNGKMTHRVYIDQILEPVVKPWLQDISTSFVLEEDRDSGHGTGVNNVVRQWKKNNGLKSYFNCPGSPDLSPIENCWGIQKTYMRRFTHWEVGETRELALEAWHEGVNQKAINKLIDSMPDRLQAIIQMEGKLTGW